MALEDNFLRLDPYNFNTEEDYSEYIGGNNLMTNELNQIVDEMLQIKDLEAQHKFELKRLEQKEELLNVKLIGVLKKMNVNEMVLPNCKFGMQISTRTAFDQQLFNKENPELFEKYKITKENEKFVFKIGNFN